MVMSDDWKEIKPLLDRPYIDQQGAKHNMAIHSYTYQHSDKEKLPAVLNRIAKGIKSHPEWEVIEMTYRCSDQGFVVYYLKKDEQK